MLVRYLDEYTLEINVATLTDGYFGQISNFETATPDSLSTTLAHNRFRNPQVIELSLPGEELSHHKLPLHEPASLKLSIGQSRLELLKLSLLNTRPSVPASFHLTAASAPPTNLPSDADNSTLKGQMQHLEKTNKRLKSSLTELSDSNLSIGAVIHQQKMEIGRKGVETLIMKVKIKDYQDFATTLASIVNKYEPEALEERSKMKGWKRVIKLPQGTKLWMKENKGEVKFPEMNDLQTHKSSTVERPEVTEEIKDSEDD